MTVILEYALWGSLYLQWARKQNQCMHAMSKTVFNSFSWFGRIIFDCSLIESRPEYYMEVVLWRDWQKSQFDVLGKTVPNNSLPFWCKSGEAKSERGEGNVVGALEAGDLLCVFPVAGHTRGTLKATPFSFIIARSHRLQQATHK